MINLTKDDKISLDIIVNRIKDNGQAKLHSNGGSMSNRISMSIYNSLENKDDFEKYFNLISKNIFKH
jgi:hypothetical protein